ncbi:Lrp/AsnC family transcriptional regulator [Infirmifilum sp. NZ]|uniref:Lrp/AsnC family transcriptional regulator n=1 Tax=Infirmifilum sp. NZ TaxID=2926850 RepID=UPI000CB12F3B|nr:Lrp/AsnC family transcriptional regulator [Infirmifilum sp. NZ]PLJ77098.1 MAG: AsnC family transcriptional regulator [Thermofilum sp. NZ13]UNQ72636.1 Lrp/AsnC family transcriptional regulator [Infirmifilum sp. NZ]
MSEQVSEVKLDHIDKKILEMLQDNAKTPYSQIASQLGISEATVHLRIRKLVNAGIIKRFQAVVDPEKVGKKVTAIIAVIAIPQKYNQVLKQLERMPEVYEIYDVTGEYSTILKVRVRNKEDLAKLIDEIGGIDGVESTKTMYVLRVIKEDTRIKID